MQQVAADTMQDKVMRKCRESMTVKEKFFGEYADLIADLCPEMARRFLEGQRLFVFGNGGSACDALHLAVEFLHPIIEKRRPFPAVALTSDMANITAIGNDWDFSLIFTDQLRLLGREGDMALGISTSGKSANVIRAFQQAKTMGMLTIAFTGKDGGRLPEATDYCFTVPTFSIHRIQEVHTTLLHIVWDLVHVALGEEDVI